MPLQLPLVVVEGRVELVRALAATAIGSHHHGFPRVTKDAHHLRDVLTQCWRIAMRHDFGADAGGAILHSAHDIAQAPAGATTPGAAGDSAGRGATSLPGAWQSATGWSHLHRGA